MLAITDETKAKFRDRFFQVQYRINERLNEAGWPKHWLRLPVDTTAGRVSIDAALRTLAPFLAELEARPGSGPPPRFWLGAFIVEPDDFGVMEHVEFVVSEYGPEGRTPWTVDEWNAKVRKAKEHFAAVEAWFAEIPSETPVAVATNGDEKQSDDKAIPPEFRHEGKPGGQPLTVEFMRDHPDYLLPGPWSLTRKFQGETIKLGRANVYPYKEMKELANAKDGNLPPD